MGLLRQRDCAFGPFRLFSCPQLCSGLRHALLLPTTNDLSEKWCVRHRSGSSAPPLLSFLLSFSDAVIAVSYFFIPGAMFTFVIKRKVSCLPTPLRSARGSIGPLSVCSLLTHHLVWSGYQHQHVGGVDVWRVHRLLWPHAPGCCCRSVVPGMRVHSRN